MTVVGLTSPTNAEFTRSLGCYDDVLRYDDAATLAEVASVYIDMSGDTAVRLAVHSRLGDLLAYSCAVGATHWDALGGGGDLPGPPPQLFFAPEQARKRAAEWGDRTGFRSGWPRRGRRSWRASTTRSSPG